MKQDSRGNYKLNLVERLIIKHFFTSPTMTSILINWKTTLAGIALLLGAIAKISSALADGFQSADIDVALAQWPLVVSGFAAIFARDANKTSEQSGAE